MRRSRKAVGEVNQSLAALVVIMMSVGLVMAAVHASSLSGADRARADRARAQAEICLDAILKDPAVTAAGGEVLLRNAGEVQAGNASLAFAPEALRFAALRTTVNESEVWLMGSLAEVLPGVLVVARPVAVQLDNGTVAPGLLRVGVQLR